MIGAYRVDSLIAHRGDSLDEFDAFWFAEGDIVLNKNDNLNNALKSVDQKMEEAVEIAMTKVREKYRPIPHYIERCMLPKIDNHNVRTAIVSNIGHIVINSFENEDIDVTKKSKKLWSCIYPSVKS